MTRLIEKHTKKEEFLHSLTHGVTAAVGAVGLVFLIIKASALRGIDLAGAIVFGISLVLLYSTSAIYHSAPYETRSREVLQRMDHCMIYVLILGTYVPVCWSALGGWLGWGIFAIVATCATVGITLNLIDLGRFHKLNLVIYVISGWMIVTATLPFAKLVGWQGFAFLLAGGVFYTVGIIFFRMTKTPYMHFVWHLFVSMGSVLHFILIYRYVY